MKNKGKFALANLLGLRGTFIALIEGLVTGTCVYFLAGSSPIAAAIFVAILVFYLRVEKRVHRQIRPGDRELFEKLAESLPGMVYQCRISPTGKCTLTYANGALEWIYEKEFSEMQKDCSSILDLVHPEDRQHVWDALLESSVNLTPWKGEYRVILPTQGTRWRFAHAKVERLSDGGTLWHGFIADVTWRKEIEERILEGNRREAAALREARDAAESADRLKSEFLTMMSHEIRTPLNGVIGFAELLKNSDLPEESRQYAGLIEASGERLLAMVNATLDLAKIESGNFSILNASFAVRPSLTEAFELLRPVAEKKGLTYNLRVAPDVPDWIVSDAMRFSQVVMNLLGNAIKFTEKGHVELVVSASPEKGQFRWLFEVVDTGPGIAPDILPKLFQPFYQADSSTDRRYEGSGLGLAISRRLARLLKGDIMVESQPGVGSKFTFALTASADAPAPANS